jgi:CheY-like chemotaxis protein
MALARWLLVIDGEVFGGAPQFLCISRIRRQNRRVTLPLALVFYEDLIPGTQLVNRLQDSNYRVQVVPKLDELLDCATHAGPMLIFADLVSRGGDVCSVIRKLRLEKATAHIPVIGFADDADEGLQAAGRAAGATLVVADSVILTHLTQFIERALQVE